LEIDGWFWCVDVTLSIMGLFAAGGGERCPCAPGYGYVGASRVRFAKDIFYGGRMRTSDWCPVGTALTKKGRPDVARGELSESDCSAHGLSEWGGSGSSDSDGSGGSDMSSNEPGPRWDFALSDRPTSPTLFD